MKIARRIIRLADDRVRIASVVRTAVSKIFPDHWSFMLGEIALYSFIVLVATGTYLTLFFEPSVAETVYEGSYAPLHGSEASAAFVSTVQLSWDVQTGLLMRQTHHWAALIFVGAIVAHLMRNFFTGAFRRPRDVNWVVGVTLLLLAILNGFAGYSLPDDLLSGTGLRIASAIVLSVPVVGSWLQFMLFGGEFPGGDIIERLYIGHVLLIPGLIAALIVVHMAILIRQKHTHFGGPGRSDSNVVGSKMWPTYTFRTLSLLCAILAVSFALGGFVQINPVWVWGPFDPSEVTTPAQPDWYVAWIEGALRLFPPVEFTVFGHLVAAPFWPAVVLPAMTFVVLYAWPWLERRYTRDRDRHHVLERPRDHPVRFGVGMWAIAFYGLLLVAGADDIIAYSLGVPMYDVVWTLRVLVLVLPVIVGVLTFILVRALRDSGAERFTTMSWSDVMASLRRRDVAAGERP